MKFQHPLQWPTAKARTPETKRKPGRFSSESEKRHCSRRPVTLYEACQRLSSEVQSWTKVGHQWRIDPEKVFITSAISDIKNDGMPYSNRRMPDDPAIAIYFHLDAELMALAINSFASIEQNIAAAAATLEAYRKLDRYGVSLAQGDLIIRLRLPEKATASNTWWSVLGVPINAGSEQIKSAYRKLVKTHHPDTGGDRAAWDRVQSAYKQAMQTVSQ